MKDLLILITIFGLIGCANPLNRETYVRYTDTGDAALLRGDYETAEIAYARAAQNVDWGNLGLEEKSGSLFNLANAKIRLGKFAEAEPLLLESVRIEEDLGNHELTQKRYFGLAIVYLETKQLDEGLVWLRKTLPVAGTPEFRGLSEFLYPKCLLAFEEAGRSSDVLDIEAALKANKSLQ